MSSPELVRFEVTRVLFTAKAVKCKHCGSNMFVGVSNKLYAGAHLRIFSLILTVVCKQLFKKEL